MEEPGRVFTALGGVGILVFITLIALGYLLLSRYFRAALFTLVSVSGGWLLSFGLKMAFDRPRPGRGHRSAKVSLKRAPPVPWASTDATTGMKGTC